MTDFPKSQLTARERLLNAAAALFYNDGIAATGIDAITHRAGVAKQSLYNNFASKADLVAAYIDARHQEWLELYAARVEHAADAKQRILAVFDAYADHADMAYERGRRHMGLRATNPYRDAVLHSAWEAGYQDHGESEADMA